MAVTGMILFGFVIGHLIGNLQIYRAGKAGRYGRFLRIEPGLLWMVRLVLLVSVMLHILMTVQLARLKTRRARSAT